MSQRRPEPALAVHGALARGAFAVAVLVSLAVLFAPGDQVPAAFPGADLLVHGGLFALLAVTGRWAGMAFPPLTGGLVFYAALTEVVQELAPLDRSGSVTDWLADVVGILAGLALWRLLADRGPAGGALRRGRRPGD